MNKQSWEGACARSRPRKFTSRLGSTRCSETLRRLLVVGGTVGTDRGFGRGHGPTQAKLVGKGQPGFPQGRPAQFGLLIVSELRMKKASFSLGAKSREVAAADFRNVRHVS
jgi:hypothetical protein